VVLRRDEVVHRILKRLHGRVRVVLGERLVGLGLGLGGHLAGGDGGLPLGHQRVLVDGIGGLGRSLGGQLGLLLGAEAIPLVGVVPDGRHLPEVELEHRDQRVLLRRRQSGSRLVGGQCSQRGLRQQALLLGVGLLGPGLGIHERLQARHVAGLGHGLDLVDRLVVAGGVRVAGGQHLLCPWDLRQLGGGARRDRGRLGRLRCRVDAGHAGALEGSHGLGVQRQQLLAVGRLALPHLLAGIRHVLHDGQVAGMRVVDELLGGLLVKRLHPRGGLALLEVGHRQVTGGRRLALLDPMAVFEHQGAAVGCGLGVAFFGAWLAGGNVLGGRLRPLLRGVDFDAGHGLAGVLVLDHHGELAGVECVYLDGCVTDAVEGLDGGGGGGGAGSWSGRLARLLLRHERSISVEHQLVVQRHLGAAGLRQEAGLRALGGGEVLRVSVAVGQQAVDELLAANGLAVLHRHGGLEQVLLQLIGQLQPIERVGSLGVGLRRDRSGGGRRSLGLHLGDEGGDVVERLAILVAERRQRILDPLQVASVCCLAGLGGVDHLQRGQVVRVIRHLIV